MTNALLMHLSRPQRDFASRLDIIIALASPAVWGADAPVARAAESLRSAPKRWRTIEVSGPSRLCSMTRTLSIESPLRSGLLRVSILGSACRLPASLQQRRIPRSRRQAPEMLAPFMHCERPREPSFIDVDPSVCSSTTHLAFVPRVCSYQGASVRANFHCSSLVSQAQICMFNGQHPASCSGLSACFPSIHHYSKRASPINADSSLLLQLSSKLCMLRGLIFLIGSAPCAVLQSARQSAGFMHPAAEPQSHGWQHYYRYC